jgi:hypothetical protein
MCFLDKGSLRIQDQKEFPTIVLLVSFKFLIKPSNVKKLLFSQGGYYAAAPHHESPGAAAANPACALFLGNHVASDYKKLTDTPHA